MSAAGPTPPWLPLLQALEDEQPGRHSYTLSLLLEANGGPRLTAQQVRPWLERLRHQDGQAPPQPQEAT
jgi:hypothetical protein